MSDTTISEAVANATAAAVRMMGTDASVAPDVSVGRSERRRTVVLPDTTVGTARALVAADTLSDAQYLADVAHDRSQVKATFAVVQSGDRFSVVPAWSANVSDVLYRTGA